MSRLGDCIGSLGADFGQRMPQTRQDVGNELGPLQPSECPDGDPDGRRIPAVHACADRRQIARLGCPAVLCGQDGQAGSGPDMEELVRLVTNQVMAALACTCCGVMAPAITDATTGRASSHAKASSNIV